MTERNIENLSELREALAKDKKHHDQQWWAKVKIRGKIPKGVSRIEVNCATSACAAGHTCLLAGDAFLIDPVLDLIEDDNGKAFYHPEYVRTVDGEERDLSARAQELLGLNWGERCILFSEENTHKETIAYLDALIAGEDIA